MTSISDSIRKGRRLFMGRVPQDARERDIEKFFKGFGHLREVLLKSGYAFIEFDDDRDADDAVYELNGKELLGERIALEHARDPATTRGGGRGRSPPRGFYGGGGGGGGRDRYGPPQRTDHRLIVENLSSRVSWQDLKDYMRQAGEVTYADAHKDRSGEGVIDFSSYEDMKNAIRKLDDTEINGRRIRLVEDRKSGGRRSRSRSRDRRSRSRSRSRSQSRRSRSKSKSRSRSKSRDKKSKSKSKSRSRSKSADKKSKSRSKSRSKSNDKRSKSPEQNGKSKSKSRSRSRD